MNFKPTGEIVRGRIETKPINYVFGGMPVYYTGCPSKVKVWEVLETPTHPGKPIDIMPYPSSPRAQCASKKELKQIVLVYDSDDVAISGVNDDHETGKPYIKTQTFQLIVTDQWKRIIKAGMLNSGVEVEGHVVFDEDGEGYFIEIIENSFKKPTERDLFIESLESFRKDIINQINNKLDDIRDRFDQAYTSNQRSI